jgi:folylpolyglutamate synthase/dihydropteroate synthase
VLDALGNPQRRLPPVSMSPAPMKGSTIAFMRAILEAAGLAVHVYTSPHLCASTSASASAKRMRAGWPRTRSSAKRWPM